MFFSCKPDQPEKPLAPDELPDNLKAIPGMPPLGAWFEETEEERFLFAKLFSKNATRIELHLFKDSSDSESAMSVIMEPCREKESSDEEEVGLADIWCAKIASEDLVSAGLSEREPLFYGYRCWGPNWPYDPRWQPGSEKGFIEDVDSSGNRFNPNKLLLDPYALEISHDTIHKGNLTWNPYLSGPQNRATDNAGIAPKGIILPRQAPSPFNKPERPFRDEIIYEVHLRGLTMNDPGVPPEKRGTYAGAALKAPYFADLGITAVEFLPLHETWNDGNDYFDEPWNGNYWGYASLSFFAPDRRYSSDLSPGGPTREITEMVRTFHEHGIKVYVDVVYNHTAEDGIAGAPDISRLASWRGIDSSEYYQLSEDGRRFHDNTGIGANVDFSSGAVRDMVIHSLDYWTRVIGVDGFRFDLASILGNNCDRGCFNFDAEYPEGVLMRAVSELPARPQEGGDGVDLIAEPWGIGPGTYRLGDFPYGWSEWNDKFRDTLRRKQNRLEEEAQSPADIIKRISGSPDYFADRGRYPSNSVNFLTAHDGFTLNDLYSYNEKMNDQQWPYGPSDGGSDNNLSWDQGGNPDASRRAARTGMAILMTSIGVPMFTGGDEFLRTQHGNNNPYNIDASSMWLDWSLLSENSDFFLFVQRLIQLRHDHEFLRKPEDSEIIWYRDDGAEADRAYLEDISRHFIAWKINDLYVAWNAWTSPLNLVIPRPADGRTWHRVADTSINAGFFNNYTDREVDDPVDRHYVLEERSVLVLESR